MTGATISGGNLGQPNGLAHLDANGGISGMPLGDVAPIQQIITCNLPPMAPRLTLMVARSAGRSSATARRGRRIEKNRARCGPTSSLIQRN